MPVNCASADAIGSVAGNALRGFPLTRYTTPAPAAGAGARTARQRAGSTPPCYGATQDGARRGGRADVAAADGAGDEGARRRRYGGGGGGDTKEEHGALSSGEGRREDDSSPF